MTGPHDDLPDLEDIDSGSIAVEGSVLTLAGDVDYLLVQAWRRSREVEPTVTHIHAAQVTFLGSAGVALVIRLVKLAAPTRVQLVSPTRPALRPLQTMGVTELLDVVE